MSDDQLAYFLNAIQPEITLWSLAMMMALSKTPYKGVDALNGTNGDTRTLMSILYKDFDYEMKLMDEERNQSLDDLHDYASGNLKATVQDSVTANLEQTDIQEIIQ